MIRNIIFICFSCLYGGYVYLPLKYVFTGYFAKFRSIENIINPGFFIGGLLAYNFIKSCETNSSYIFKNYIKE